MPGQHSRLKLFPVLALAIFLLPVMAGLLFTWAPAFGYLSAAGSTRFNLEPFTALLHHPSLPGALRSTLISGLGASLFSLGLALWIAATLYGTRLWAIIQMSLAPLLSLPHAAFAIGFTFLIAPSGWLIRAVSPYPSGFIYPPDWITAGDPWAISLTLTMVCKETPFLLLMIFSGLSRIDVRRTIWVGRSLGYRRLRIWTRLIIPQLYPMLRLPLLAVLAYSLSVVDLAYIIGPSLPPTLAVLIDRWFNSPEISNRFIGAAGALLLLFVTLLCIGSALAVEYIVNRIGSRKILDGRRASPFEVLFPTGTLYAVILLGVNLFSLLALLLWSVTRTWRFPHFFPSRFSLANWTTSFGQLIEPLWVSGLAALLSCVLAIFIVIGFIAGAGFPGTAGFVAEIHTLIGGYQSWSWVVIILSMGILISVAYGIRTVRYLFTGPVKQNMAEVVDLHPREFLGAATLTTGIILLGIFPTLLLQLITPVVKAFTLLLGAS